MIIKLVVEVIHYKMLGFKFIEDVSDQGLTGPVPVLGVFGGIEHTPVMSYSNTIFDRSTLVCILAGDWKEALAGYSYSDSFSSFNSLNNSWNLLSNTEDFIGTLTNTSSSWTLNGNSGGDSIVLSYDVKEGTTDNGESPLSTFPATKVMCTGNSTVKSLVHDELTTVDQAYYTASIYLSYGEIGDHPNFNGPATHINIDNPDDVNGPSKASIVVVWKDDGNIQVTAEAGTVDTGYEKLVVGNRTWYRIWWVGQSHTGGGVNKYYFKITPCGWVDINVVNAPEGWLLMAHPSLTQLSFDPTSATELAMKPVISKYSPSYKIDGVDSNEVFNNILAGPESNNLTVPMGNDYILFDAVTNKPITEYVEGYNKSYISADTYKQKHLLYRDPDGIYKLVKPHNRFPVIVKKNDNGTVYIPEMNVTSAALRQNSLEAFDMYVGIRNNKHSWKLTYKKSIELIEGKIVKIHGGTPRQSTIWGEKPIKITNKLVQLSERGLNIWNHAIDGAWISEMNLFYKEVGGYSLLLNSDIEISDIDPERGRILFTNDVPEDLEITYCLNNEWENIPVELNPTITQKVSLLQSESYEVPTDIKIKIDKSNGSIYYELNGSGRILQNGVQPNWIVDTLDYERYSDVATVSFNYDSPELIDIRREGGMLIDKNYEKYEIDSHTTWGFMGVNPTELNISVVKIPDKALEELLYQFEEDQPLYNPESPLSFPLDWGTNREMYLNLIKDDPDDYEAPNPIKEELVLYSKRVMPAGVRTAVTDKLDNLLFYDYDNSAKYGDYL